MLTATVKAAKRNTDATVTVVVVVADDAIPGGGGRVAEYTFTGNDLASVRTQTMQQLQILKAAQADAALGALVGTVIGRL